MSRREGRDSHGRRHHSRFDREPSPKKPRRDVKLVTTERTHSSSHKFESKDSGHDEKRNKQLQDAVRLDYPLATETKMPVEVAKNGSNVEAANLSRGTQHSSDPKETPRSKSYFQHDERGSAGQGGRSYASQTADHQRWGNQKETSGNKAKERTKEHGLQKKDKQSQSRRGYDKVWKHDGYFQLESEGTPTKKRPAFSEKKITAEPQPVVAVPGPDLRPADSDIPHGQDKPEGAFRKADERSEKREEWSTRRTEAPRMDYRSRERFYDGGTRGRDNWLGSRYSDRRTYRQGGIQVEKWKHDLFDEANRSPSPKNEEEQIAKVEALLAL